MVNILLHTRAAKVQNPTTIHTTCSHRCHTLTTTHANIKDVCDATDELVVNLQSKITDASLKTSLKDVIIANVSQLTPPFLCTIPNILLF
jgi:hypothetical protein